MYCNGVEKMVVHGMNVRVVLPHRRVTCMYCNGVEKMVANGMSTSVLIWPVRIFSGTS